MKGIGNRRDRRPTGSMDDHLWDCDGERQDEAVERHAANGDLDPSRPTRFLPGTLGKLVVMALRVRRGLPALMPGDFVPAPERYGRYIASRSAYPCQTMTASAACL
jgi:hypothetical protein